MVAKPDSNWDATTARNVATTVLQHNPDICGIIDFWYRDATGTAIRDAGLQDKVYFVTTGGGEKSVCDAIANGTFNAFVSTELKGESGLFAATTKYLLQSGLKLGAASPYLYTLLRTITKENLQPDSCWDLKALQAEAAK